MRKKCMLKFTSIVLLLLMVISMLPQTAFAGSSLTIWDGTSDTSWYNDTDTSFTIATAEQLAGLAELVNAGNHFTGKTITLGADIQLNDTTGWETWNDTYTGNQWTPIGTAYSNQFNGTFDGNNKTISGVYIYLTIEDVCYTGVFGYMNEDATVKNLNIAASNIHVDAYYGAFIGGIVGQNFGKLSNCNNSGNVYATSTKNYGARAGGIVGYNYNNVITDCSNSGTIIAESDKGYAGGIAGVDAKGIINCFNSGTVSGFCVSGGIAGDSVNVDGCHNTGIVSDGFNAAGGIVGRSYNGTVTNSYNEGAVSGTAYFSDLGTGGIAGYNLSSIITNCYNTGAVSGIINVGGISGTNNSTIVNCYNVGTVNGTNYNVGGLVGCNSKKSDHDPSVLTNCYNLGAVSGGSVVGSIAGLNTYDTTYTTNTEIITNCYWLDSTATSDIGTKTANSSNIVMMTSDDMKTEAFMEVLNTNVTALSAADETLPIRGWKFIAGQNNDYPVYKELLTGTASITGDAVYGAVLTASLSGSNNSGTLSYQWIRTNLSGDVTIAGATGTTYTLTADDIGYKIKAKISGSEEWGSIQSAPTSSVQKADCETTDIAAPVTSEVTSNRITLTAVDGYQYVCVESGETSLSDWWKNSNVFTGLSSNTTYDIYQRIPQTSTHKASNPSERLTVTTGLSDNWIDYVSEPTTFDDATKTYTITSAGELSWIAKQVQEGNNFEGYTFELTSDIALSDHFWVAIGGMKTPFSGTFNGNGHTISNLKMDASTQVLCGLFGFSDGTLKNILLDGVNISGDIDNEFYIGALCGASMGTIIDGLVSNGTISVNGKDGAEIRIGIVCGYNMGSIYSCGANGTVTINGNTNGSFAGGLVGNTEGETIYNSYANVSITGDDGSETGGLVGFAYGGNIQNCVSYGDTSVPSNASTTHLGGLIGNNSSYDPCVVSNSYWNTSAAQSYCGVARASDEMLGIGNNTPETDAADTNCTGKTLAELKSDAFLSTLNDYVGTKNAAGALSYPLQIWKIITSNDDFPGFIEIRSTNPDTTNPDTSNPNTPDGGTSHSSSGGGSVYVPAESSPVEVNGNKQDAGTSDRQVVDNKTVTTIKVDDAKLDKILESRGENITVTLPSTGSDVTVGELNGQTVKNMETKEATLEIKTETVTYSLPASQINIDDVSSQIGKQVELKDIKVSVKIAEPPADTVKVVEDAASKGNYQLVVKPIEFEITCMSGDKTIEVSKFNGYVERTVAIPDGIEPNKITTGIVLNSDGTFSHVPTTIVVIDGKYYAKISSLTNSTYSVIYNPVTFTDVSNHWAKEAINDMGSRMVVTGIGDGIYEPERSITRAEFAAIVVRAMGLKKGTLESNFNDVTLADWFNGYVDTAASYRLITGYNSTSFGPNDTITREQAMTILARAMKLTRMNVSPVGSETSELLANYSDAGLVSAYAKVGAAACVKAGIVSGTTAATISPKDYVTRAEVAVMVQRLLQKSGLI